MGGKLRIQCVLLSRIPPTSSSNPLQSRMLLPHPQNALPPPSLTPCTTQHKHTCLCWHRGCILLGELAHILVLAQPAPESVQTCSTAPLQHLGAGTGQWCSSTFVSAAHCQILILLNTVHTALITSLKVPSPPPR